MQAIKRVLQWSWHALFLDQDAYEEMRDDDNPFVEGLFIVVIVSVLVGLVGFIGVLLARGATPDLAAMKNTVLESLKSMEWYQAMLQSGGQEALRMFNQFYDLGWQFLPQLFGYPEPSMAALNIVLLPVQMILVWLVYGVVAHLCARVLGGKGTLGQTLGTTALAQAPNLLSLALILPFVTIGGVVGTWTMVCRYTALKTAHELSWPRALAATLLPGILFALLVIILGVLFGGVFASLIAGGMAQ